MFKPVKTVQPFGLVTLKSGFCAVLIPHSKMYAYPIPLSSIFPWIKLGERQGKQRKKR